MQGTQISYRIGNLFSYIYVKEQNVRIIAKKTLREFWKKHEDSEQQLLSAWYQEAKKGQWKSPKEIKKNYPSASIVADNRVVFNIKGNKYRLVVAINYKFQIVWIRFIGTHPQYDKIDVTKI